MRRIKLLLAAGISVALLSCFGAVGPEPVDAATDRNSDQGEDTSDDVTPDGTSDLARSSDGHETTSPPVDHLPASGIAFVADTVDGHWRDVFILDPVTLEVVPLVYEDDFGGCAENLAWSPDGTRLVYLHQCFTIHEPDDQRLMLLDLTQANPEPEIVLQSKLMGIEDGARLGSPTWTPDGQFVLALVRSMAGDPDPGSPWAAWENWLIRITPETGAWEVVGEIPTEEAVLSVSIAPDGETLALDFGHSAWGICIDEAGNPVDFEPDIVGEPCPYHRIDLYSATLSDLAPQPSLVDFDPTEFGSCDGDRLRPRWSRGEPASLMFEVTDCPFKIPPLESGEDGVSSVGIAHVFLENPDGSYARLVDPDGDIISETSPTWGPAGSGQVALLAAGTPTRAGVDYNSILVVDIGTNEIVDVTPLGFEAIREIAWRPGASK